ncbi:hypothetical protein [Deinococcus sp.]|uniref:hypothetical protein n=1 Tax=Deinococcus sp. TaxID=47478 RepID=UPI0025D6AF4B|nr:hypothetical protein [Deinococcus sp.]
MTQGRLDYLLALLPAAVLCVVATAYLWRWQHEPLSSWRGGGFGMYADINDERGQVLRVYVLREGWTQVQLTDRLKARVTQVRLNPSRSAVTAFADYLACNERFLGQHPGVTRLRLEYWEFKFEVATSTMRLVKRLEVSRAPCAAP